MNYEDYFKPEESFNHMDSMISDAMRSDILFKNDDEMVEYLKRSKSILRDETLTCYQFLKEKGLLQEYHRYRMGSK